jgi:photosystem II stability/assembly factor-like uncharacterized protein
VATGSFQPVAVAFLDRSTGWAALTAVTPGGSRAVLEATMDGGATWAPLPLPDVEAVRGVWFETPRLGWLSVQANGVGEILGTADGGSTWAVQRRSSALPAGPLAFVSATTGWLAGDGVLYATTSGGGPPQPQSP